MDIKKRVTSVNVTDSLPEFMAEDDPGRVPAQFRYVYADTGDGQDPGELRLPEGADVDQWFDDSGLDWSPEAKAAVLRAVQPQRARTTVLVGGSLDRVRD